MNSIINDYYPTFQMYQAMRDQLMALLSDEDLSYSLVGDNPSLGSLCRAMGEVEHAYIQSFKSFRQDFSYRNDEPGLQGNVARLTAWYQEMDEALQETIAALSEEDIASRTIDRGGFVLPLQIQLEVYKEALLIFYGKASVYLRGMGKELPEQWQAWIG